MSCLVLDVCMYIHSCDTLCIYDTSTPAGILDVFTPSMIFVRYKYNKYEYCMLSKQTDWTHK